MIDFKRFFTKTGAHVTGSDESRYVAAKPFRGLNWGSIAVPAAITQWENEGGSLPPTALAMTGLNHSGDNTKSPLNANVAISDALPLGVLITDVYGNCVYSNAAYERLSGRKQAHLLGSHWVSFIHPDDRDGLVRDWQEAMRHLRPFISEARLVRTDGSVIWVRQTITVVNESRLEYGHAHILEDISVTREYAAAQRARQQELSDENARAQVTLDRIGDAVICTNLEGQINYMNAIAEKMTGWPRSEAMHQTLGSVFRVLDATTRTPVHSPAAQALAQRSSVEKTADSVLLNRNGSELTIEASATPLYNHLDEMTGVVMVFHDVKFSQERPDRNAHLAEHDNLTGLPSRVALHERFIQAQALARRHDKQMALLFIDLDDFKEINDRLGHDSGDRLLINLASRLLACVRATDTVCRYGGDEFVVLLSEISHLDHAAEVAAKLHAAVAGHAQHDGQAIELSLSIGVSVFPDDGQNAAILLKKADKAMYQAKARGKNRTCTALRP